MSIKQTKQVALDDLHDQIASILNDPRVKQAMVFIIGDDDEIAETKGHFYNNAVLLNTIVKDYKTQVFRQLFDDTPDPEPDGRPNR